MSHGVEELLGENISDAFQMRRQFQASIMH